ncbi:uncharacterized protein LOC128221742 [Mya arenaria]|uniref:uncharacterized protein LOC128221742 n=1 Tax=Mya arenaria TaxID=6604 RepID=UPI0022E63B98|nr:uncharacterized protein LOC128221742 [Mya arenaria]
MFQTDNGIMNEENNEIPTVTKRDITKERCKQHPTERAIFLCKTHESMICGRCLHSGHLDCVHDVVDLLHEAVTIDFEKVNKMKSALNEVKEEILLLHDESEDKKTIATNNADKCVQECMELGNQIKQRVDELTSGIRDGITKTHDENMSNHSRITETCDVKTKWCDSEKSKIDDFVGNNMVGYLYLMSRHFEKEVSEVRSHLKEIKDKHTFNKFYFKQNKVILKCVFEDLEEVCEQQKEAMGSNDGNFSDIFESKIEINKTRRELTALLNQAKQDLDNTELARKKLCDELKQVKQDLAHSEKTSKKTGQELLKAKQGVEKSEQEGANIQKQFLHIQQYLNWTQPTGTVVVKTETHPSIELVFTFPDGIQTRHHPSRGKPYKGGTFVGNLEGGSDGLALCMMLKEAFKRGQMFNVGKNGNVVLNGISLYKGRTLPTPLAYLEYKQKMKAELAAKGITEAKIDQTGTLEETVTVDG